MNHHMDDLNSTRDSSNLAQFYEEPLEKEDYDVDLIKDMFFKKRINLTHDTKMRSFFRDEMQRITTTMQDNTVSDMAKSEVRTTTQSDTDELLVNLGGSDSQDNESDEYDDTIMPDFQRDRRSGMIREAKFTVGNRILATQAQK